MWYSGFDNSNHSQIGFANEITVKVDEVKQLPTEIRLNQNYPNPFNPTTTIIYEIPEKSIVTLKVYDILGNEITTLLNEEKQPGSYKVNWNANSISSGIYFYTLSAGNYFSTKKMVLIK
jgi:hypothetical protein